MNVGNLLAENPRDTIEGEIVAAEPTELASRQEAQLRAHRIRTHLQAAGNAYREIAEATARRDWQALGYESWEAWRDGEFGEDRLVIPREARPQIAAIMHAAGASTRAIGSALGVDARTVRRDLSGGASAPPDKVTGRDGKEYAPTKPIAHKPQAAADPQGAPASAPNGTASANGSELRPSPATGAGEAGAASSRPAPVAANTPDAARPSTWDPEEKRQHEQDVRRRQDIDAAHRYADRIITDLRAAAAIVLTGCRYGETGLVTADMVRELREIVDLLEREL